MRRKFVIFGLVVCGLVVAAVASAAEEAASAPAVVASTQPASAAASVVPAELLKKLADHKISVKPLTEPLAGGFIDWTSQEFCASGSAKLAGHQAKDFLMAQNAARLTAARNAALLLGGIRVGPGGRFLNVKEGQIQVDVILHDYKESDSDYDPKTEMVTSTIRIPFYGARGIVQIAGASEGSSRRWSWPMAADVDAKPVDVVVIDARECKFQPSLLPTLATESGEVVFGPSDVPAGGLSQRAEAVLAIAQKSADLSAARVLTLHAKLADEKNPSCLVLDAQSVTRLSATSNARKLMIEGNVVIVSAEAAK